MTRYEFMSYIQTVEVNDEIVSSIERKYSEILPEQIRIIVSCSQESIFFDDGWRLLSFDEVMDASDDLHVDFVNLKLLPLFDTGDNDFIVYHFENKIWSKFNIVDEVSFKNKKNLDEFFEK